MLRILPRGCGQARLRLVVLVLPLFLAVTYFLSRPGFYDSRPRAASVPADRQFSNLNHLHHGPDVRAWWDEFFTRLKSTRVTARPVKIKGKAPLDNWRPDIDTARADLLKLSEDDEARFRESHATFVRQLAEFAGHLPYHANTTGIVTTAGVPNFGLAVSLVLMTRQSKSRLPIQIILDSSAPWVEYLCAHTLPQYDATCLFLEDMWAGLGRDVVPKLKGFQWKSVSMIASTFQNVLFLDADCLPVRKPDPIFDQGSEPFTSTGLITWPDFWTQSTSPLFYKIAGGLEVPPLTSRPTSESGMIAFDKARHGDTLLLAAYYNYNGPKHYYPMFTQHGAGEGDKESVLQAALVLDALRRKGVYKQPTAWMRPGAGVKKGYWDVKMMPEVHGRTVQGKWRGMSMLQMDPMQDYRAVMAAVEKANLSAVMMQQQQQKPQQPRTGGNFSRLYPLPPPAPVDETAFLTDSTFLAAVANLTTDNPEDPRVMFFHHNGVKLDFTRIIDPESAIAATDEQGRYLRLWTDPEWHLDRLTNDGGSGEVVERLLWWASMHVYCQPELTGGYKRLRRVCERMREIGKQVYQV